MEGVGNMAINVAAAYLDNKIKTATPAELTLMLFDGSIKFCNIAIMAIEENDNSKANTNIIKAQKIMLELRSSLDHKYEISKNLDLLYEYIYSELIEANMKKDKNVLDEVLESLRELRDTWKEAMIIETNQQRIAE